MSIENKRTSGLVVSYTVKPGPNASREEKDAYREFLANRAGQRRTNVEPRPEDDGHEE